LSPSEFFEFARKQSKKELREIAQQKIGCGFATLDNYLFGRTDGGEKLLKKLALFLKCREGELPKRLPKESKKKDIPLREGAEPAEWAEHFTSEELNEKVIKILQDGAIPLAERHRRAEIFLAVLRERLPI